jgi:hypothetical protein
LLGTSDDGVIINFNTVMSRRWDDGGVVYNGCLDEGGDVDEIEMGVRWGCR